MSSQLMGFAMATGEAINPAEGEERQSQTSEVGDIRHGMNGKGEGHEGHAHKTTEDEILQEAVAMDYVPNVQLEGRKTPSPRSERERRLEKKKRSSVLILKYVYQ